MKLLILFLCLSFNAMAQDSWKIKLNEKIVLRATGEDEAKHIVSISLSAKPSTVGITIAEKTPQKGWIRSIIIVDENDNEVYRKEGKREVKLSSTVIRKFAKAGNFRVYTIALPKDPELAARVRVRRVHLCTLKFT